MPVPVTHEMLNAALWQESSARYEGITLQLHQLAHSNVDQAMADPQWDAMLEQSCDQADLTPTIILDLKLRLPAAPGRSITPEVTGTEGVADCNRC